MKKLHTTTVKNLQYMDKKRAEGKPYKVYMMASANKFLRRYYAIVKAYLEGIDLA